MYYFALAFVFFVYGSPFTLCKGFGTNGKQTESRPRILKKIFLGSKVSNFHYCLKAMDHRYWSVLECIKLLQSPDV